MTKPTFSRRIATDTPPAIGMWVASADAYIAEICAGSGLDWLLLDTEHAPNDLRGVLAQLQAVAPYPISPVVRLPVGDRHLMKQYLDIGVTNLVIPMVESAEMAAELVAATRYPPSGVRGVGSAFARASRWGRVADYLTTADDQITLILQIESVKGVAALDAILDVEGVDGIFLGPADLAGSMGYLGSPTHPDVITSILTVIGTCVRAGIPVGINAFDESLARRYVDAGASFLLVGADVHMLARGSDALAQRYDDIRGE